MRTRRIFWLFSLTLALILWSAYPGLAEVEPKPETRGPIIIHAFAVEKGYYGYIWKIYLEAEDPGGQMLRIASVVEQTGKGGYATDWIYLKPQDQKHFKGYIQWNTFSTKASYLPEWTQITLRASVFDRARNESNAVVFPFTFEITPEQYAYQLPAPFDQGDLPRLGYVMIDLYNPGEEYGDHGLGIMHERRETSHF